MNQIQWGEKRRPVRMFAGHSAVRTGTTYGAFHEIVRTHIECECGTRLSGKGNRGGLSSWEKHVKREQEKAAKRVTADTLGFSKRA